MAVGLGTLVAAPLLARVKTQLTFPDYPVLPITYKRCPRGVSLIAWLENIRDEHRTNRVLAGPDVVEFFRGHYGNTRGADVDRYTPDSDCRVKSFTKFDRVEVPVRHLHDKCIVNPFFTEWVKLSSTEWHTQSKPNPYWDAAPLELIWAFGGSTVYACVIDRFTMEIDHKPEFILNPAWQSAPYEVRRSGISDPTDFNAR